ncbi:MAG: 3-isopropylmalate dehydratase small subunit [Deltaproteobacteria bacterium]|nr:3-isopropylmalate dehydratase small subunit [Deltaproteobacteria bacterium]
MNEIKQVGGRAVVVRGPDIDTDRIVPARYLKEITFNRMGEYPFFDERYDADGNTVDHPFNEERFQGAEVLVVNRNFGCGSSREHAPQALYRWGIRVVIGESFGPIFAGSSVLLGMPTVMASPEDVGKLMALVESDPTAELTVDLEARKVRLPDGSDIDLDISEGHRNALTTGTWDSTALLLDNMDEVAKTSDKLPYTSDFEGPAPL